MNITPKNNPKEFERFLFDKINLNLFHHKFLLDYLQEAKVEKKKLYDKSVINYTVDGWILILHGDMLIIHGENWNLSQFEELREIIDLSQFRNFTISGNTELINALLEYYKIDDCEVLKDRILYKTNKIENVEIGDLIIESGNASNIDELATMLQQYYHEEYKGDNDKSIEEMRSRMLQVIATGKIFVLKNSNNDILSFCTIIDPDIGILFTKSECRNKSYGKILLAYCSKLLLAKNDEVFVMTDRTEIASNKTCSLVGFKPYFNNSLIAINCC